jgi:hypothetical protein
MTLNIKGRKKRIDWGKQRKSGPKKKPKRLSYYERSKRRLKKRIKQAEDEACDKFLSSLGNVKLDDEIEQEIELKKFLARSPAVKKLYADAEWFKNYIKENHGSELNFSKENLFPTQWMRKNKGIKDAMENRSIIINAINHVTNLTRRLSKEERKKMFDLTKSFIGDKKYRGKHRYTVFLADAAFYHKAAKAIGCSVSKAKAVITGELVDIGTVRKLGSIATGERGRPPVLHADGFITKCRKIPFLKNTKKFRQALPGLSKKISA